MVISNFIALFHNLITIYLITFLNITTFFSLYLLFIDYGIHHIYIYILLFIIIYKKNATEAISLISPPITSMCDIVLSHALCDIVLSHVMCDIMHTMQCAISYYCMLCAISYYHMQCVILCIRCNVRYHIITCNGRYHVIACDADV